ncbi:MAG: hypothetical protein ACKVH0_00960 [Alphaproteobacteria bacterium]|jgi:acyl dehydratase
MTAPAHETVGHALPLWETSVTAERQATYHKYAAIDGSLYGAMADASVLANDCLHGARPREALGAKRLHAGVRVRQTAPLSLGTPLTVAATVEALRPAKRGRYIHIDFAFQQADGATPIRIDHKSLILDPTPLPKNAASQPPAPETGYEEVRRLQLTPEMVSGYSFEFPHLEGHHDPEAAARIGMRAPIAQGLMGFTLLLAERMRIGAAQRFDVEASFVRPIFWDEELSLEARGDTEFRALNPAGKTVSELLIHSWDS